MEREFRCSIGGVVLETGGMVDHRGNKLNARRADSTMPDLDDMFFIKGNENFCFAVDLPTMNYYLIDSNIMEGLGYSKSHKFNVGEVGIMRYETDRHDTDFPKQGENFGKTIRPITSPFIYPKAGLMRIAKDIVFVEERQIGEDLIDNVNPYFFDVSKAFVTIADFDKYAVLNTDTLLERFSRRFPKAEDIHLFSLNDRLEIECKIDGVFYGRTYGAYELDIKDDLFTTITTADKLTIYSDELTHSKFWEVEVEGIKLIFTSKGREIIPRIKELFPDHNYFTEALLSSAEGPSVDAPFHGIEIDDGKLEITVPTKYVIHENIK